MWASLLRTGGALGLAWNTHVARRDELTELLSAHGLVVRDDSPHRGFRHRVAQATVRD